MARKSKLLAALDAHKGRDYEAEKRKKQLKTAEKRKRNKKAGEATLATEEDQNGDPAQEADRDDFEAFSDNEIGLNGTSDHVAIQPKDIERQQTVESPSVTDQDMSEDGAEDEGVDVALSDLSASDMEDTVPHQRLTINNAAALLTSRSRIALLRHQPKNIPPPFHLHNSLISSDLASASIPDANDDLTRETQFYAIARTAALEGRNLLKKENIPFTRPHDYFAEMVKTDIHMEKIKSKLRREASEKKGREEARRQRDARKFGKQVQVAKEQERAKEKRNTLEKIKDLKRSEFSVRCTDIIPRLLSLYSLRKNDCSCSRYVCHSTDLKLTPYPI